MQLINPFKQNESNNEAQLMDKNQEFQRENILTENSIHPQSYDEQAWFQKQEMFAELRRWQQDLSEKFKHAFEELSGVRFDDNGMAVKIPNILPLTSINGAYQLINFVKILDHNVMRSNYSETSINLNLRYGVGYPLIQFIKDNRRELGIDKNFGKLQYLVNYLFNLVEPTYRHALNDGERRHESEIHKIVETKNIGAMPEKKGVFR